MRRAARAIIRRGDELLLMHRNKFGQEYDILIGGGVEIGEEPVQTLLREVAEEAGVSVSQPKLVFIERAQEPYGTQYIFLCDYVSGEARIEPSSIEAQISRMGKNLYEPLWRKISDLEQIEVRSDKLKRALMAALKDGFPDQPIDITDT